MMTAEIIGTAIYQAEPAQVSAARAWLRELLAKDYSAVADDAETCLSEVVGNAVLHSRSGDQHGGGDAGDITITVFAAHGDAVRIEVVDAGSTDTPHVLDPLDTSECGRGLFIVKALTRAWGAEVDGGPCLVWFEVAPAVDGAR